MNERLFQNTLNTRWIYVNGQKTETIRSDKLDKCTKEEIIKLKEWGIQAVIDIREENKARPSPFLFERGIEYHNIPIIEGDIYKYYDEIGIDLDVESRRLAKAEFYIHLIDGHLSQVKQILQLWVKHDGHVLIHCSLGRDRTGIISAIIQRSLGATEQEIIDEYAMSAINLASLNLQGDKYIDYDVSQKVFKHFLLKAQPLLNQCFEYIKELMIEKIKNIMLANVKAPSTSSLKHILIVGEKPYSNKACLVLPYPVGYYQTQKLPEIAFLSPIDTQSMILIMGVLFNSVDTACLVIDNLRKQGIPMSVFAEFLYDEYAVILINRYSSNGNGRKTRDKHIIPLINSLKKHNLKVLSVGNLKTIAYDRTVYGISLDVIHSSPINASKIEYIDTYFYRTVGNGNLNMSDFAL